jgi:hypothetical protein
LNRSRLVPVLVTWLALLGMAVPAAACAATLFQDDCCPAEQPPPCGGDEGHAAPQAASAVCCVAAPDLAQAPAATITRTGCDKPSGFDVPDLWLDANPDSLAIADPQHRRDNFTPSGGVARTGAPLYLLTGRLRL